MPRLTTFITTALTRPRLPRVLTLVVGVCLAGCGDTPARGFERLYEALADGDVDEGMEHLTARARARLAAAAASRGLTAAQALAVTFPKATLKEIVVLSDDGERAVLEVSDALDHAERVPMRKEAGVWKVDVEGSAP